MFLFFICVLLMMGKCAWTQVFISCPQQIESAHPAYSLPPSYWRPKTSNNSICMLVYSVITQICPAGLKQAKQTCLALANCVRRLCMCQKKKKKKWEVQFDITHSFPSGILLSTFKSLWGNNWFVYVSWVCGKTYYDICGIMGSG